MALALVGLALVGLTQVGCRSNGCSNCNIGQKLSNGVQGLRSRVFSGHGGGGCSTCGTVGAYEEGGIVEQGVPITTVPGGVVVPGPGAAVPPPAIESEAGPELRALPPGPGAAPGGSASSRNSSGTNRSAYEAVRPKNELVASKRGGDLARAYRSPTSEAAYAPDPPDILDNLPPVELPPDIGRKVAPLDDPPPTPGGRAAKGDDPNPGDSAPPVVPSTDSNTKTTSVEPGSAGDRPVPAVARTEGATATRAIAGIRRAAEVAPQVLGGSLPGPDGLAALQRKGCRTLVDLRPPAEVAPGFADQVIDQGMTYIPLPFALAPISGTRLDRFNDALAQANLRPIYFCDGDGRRAGLAWYLRLRALDRADAASARKQAEGIGLVAADLAGADRFLAERTVTRDELTLRSAGPQLTWGTLEPVALESSASPAADPAPPPAVVVAPAPPAGHVPPTPTPVARRSGEDRAQAFDRNASWRPVAALVLSGLGVPLAYWSRATLGQLRTPRRASLTAKGPGPRKALPSSDA